MALLAKEPAVDHIETNQWCLPFNQLNARCWFPVAVFVRRCDLCNLPLLRCPGTTQLGEDHPDTLQSLNNLGMVLHAKGHLAEAERLLRDALEKSPGAQLQRFPNGAVGSGSGVTP